MSPGAIGHIPNVLEAELRRLNLALLLTQLRDRCIVILEPRAARIADILEHCKRRGGYVMARIRLHLPHDLVECWYCENRQVDELTENDVQECGQEDPCTRKPDRPCEMNVSAVSRC